MGIKIQLEREQRLVFYKEIEEINTFGSFDMWVGKNKVDQVWSEIGEESGGGGWDWLPSRGD